MDWSSKDEEKPSTSTSSFNQHLMLPTVCAPREPSNTMLPTVCVDQAEGSRARALVAYSLVRTQSLDLSDRTSSSTDSAILDQFSPSSDCCFSPAGSTPGITLTPLDLRSPKRHTRFTFDQRGLSSGDEQKPESPLRAKAKVNEHLHRKHSSDIHKMTLDDVPSSSTGILRSHSDSSVIIPKKRRSQSDSDDPTKATAPLVTHHAIKSVTRSQPKAFYCPTIVAGPNMLNAFAAMNSLRLMSADPITRSLPLLPISHQQSDDPAKPYECPFCRKVFRRSDVYNRHMRTHTDERPYVCQLCGRAFRRSDHVRTHIRTHTAEKPYSCPKCPYTAARSDVMGRHVKSHKRKEKEKEQRTALAISSQDKGTANDS